VEPLHTESVFRHDRLLGTVVDVRVRTVDAATGLAADRAIVDEIDRLEAVFSVYRPDSELNRWKRDDVPHPSDEFIEVMSTALDWHIRSNGAFNPMSGLLSEVWHRAETTGTAPSAGELREVVASIEAPRFTVRDRRVERVGDCAALNLNAIAKGYIVDRATAAATERFGTSMVLVSAGGDLLHRGSPPSRVGIEHPLRPFDNEPPITVIDVHDEGLATSGGSRRGFRIGNRRFSHVIDPRTGEPISAQASITVVAPTAMDADVLATVLGLVDPADAVAESNRHDEVVCLVIGTDGSLWPNARWRQRSGESLP
jgi:thiamine biosynthesis lipoprotein